MPAKIKDLTGQRFGQLTVIQSTDERRHRCVVWLCKCDCGNLVKVDSGSLHQGGVTSCGCHRTKVSKVNGAKASKAAHWSGTQPGKLKPDNPLPVHNTSGVKGVCWHKREQKWTAYIMLRQKRIYLGAFTTLEEAAVARKRAEEKYFQPILEEFEKG